jgi:hypothetical protein
MTYRAVQYSMSSPRRHSCTRFNSHTIISVSLKGWRPDHVFANTHHPHRRRRLDAGNIASDERRLSLVPVHGTELCRIYGDSRQGLGCGREADVVSTLALAAAQAAESHRARVSEPSASSSSAFHDLITRVLYIPPVTLRTRRPEPQPEVIYLRHVERARPQQKTSPDEPLSTEPPRFVIPLKDCPNVVEGARAVFEGKITPIGDPTMEVEWLFNGRPLEASEYLLFLFSAAAARGRTHNSENMCTCTAAVIVIHTTSSSRE